jgi:hypothetical protein
MKMHGVGKAEGTIRVVLNQPVSPLIDTVDLDDIVGLAVAGVAVHHILKDGVAPVDINGAAIDLPDKERGATNGQLNRQGILGLLDELVDLNIPWNDRDEVQSVQAVVVARSNTRVGRQSIGGTLIVEDGSWMRV